MIFECAQCEARIDGKVLGEHEFYQGEEPPHKTSLLECAVCKYPSVVIQDMWQGYNPQGELVTDWESPVRVWPKAEIVDWKLPANVRSSLEEATRCFKAQAYNACAVMCGRTLENVCKECGVTDKNLSISLKKLLDKEIIDKKIYIWGDALRKERNIGAHAAEEKINRKDAEDILDFTNAICQYVFILTAQFEHFMDRKKVTNPSN